ncbi:unnamed protein product [Eruca vesicaria subsp. sativa]|uniref:F-box domain-containing protein n=1 Tax=Eruca vesicaria subsp. sativa TaxID=29727 RepID=A0ABC8JSY1_ERUVS|nr:unnamed protein product [Eruca vesicaria subsp. sativa]
MSIQRRPLSRLESLPQELQTEIISRVAKSSRRDVRNLMEASPRMAKAAAQPPVYKNINLRPLTVHPRASLTK